MKSKMHEAGSKNQRQRTSGVSHRLPESQTPRLPGSQCHCQRQAKRRRHSSLNLTLNLSIFPSHAVFKSSNTQILSVFLPSYMDKTASDATPRPRVKTTWAEGLLPLPLQNQWRSMRHQTASIATDSTDSRTIKIHKCHNNQSRLTTDQGEQQDRSSSPASQVHQGACAITYYHPVISKDCKQPSVNTLQVMCHIVVHGMMRVCHFQLLHACARIIFLPENAPLGAAVAGRKT